jgi:hypothetical protein
MSYVERRGQRKKVTVTWESNRVKVYHADMVTTEPVQWRLEDGNKLTLVPMQGVEDVVIEYVEPGD